MNKSDTLDALQALIVARIDAADKDSSYVAKLSAAGTDAILKKVGEEATETVIAGKDDDDDKLIYETADLWFHCMLMLAARGLSVEQVINELDRRMGISGLQEKASRSK